MTTTEETTRDDSALRVTFRRPELGDGKTFYRLAEESGALDLNSAYAYLMWCDHFADTSVIAEVDGEPAGFVMGFSPPGREHVLFVWQVATSDSFRGHGIASRMIDALLEREARLTAVEATVTPSNTASQKLFRSLARRSDCSCTETSHIEAEHFPPGDHEPETLFHISPISKKQ